MRYLSKRPIHLGLRLERFSGIYLAALFIAIFGIWEPGLFLTTATFHSVLDNEPTTLMLSIAVLIPLVGGTFDLSAGAAANLSAILCVVLQTVDHWSIAAAVCFTLVASLVIGIVNGFLVVVVGVNSFIATLGVSTILGAVQQIISGGTQPLAPTSPQWGQLALLDVGGLQVAVIYGFIAVILAWWLLDRTAMGRYLYAIGGNAEASRLSGVRVGRWVCLSLIASSLISGVAGVLFASANGPSLTFGASLLLPAFAAVFLGSTQIKPGRFNVAGTVVAVYVLAIGVTGLSLVTGVLWLNDMFSGVALVGAVGFASWRQRQAEHARRTKQATEGRAPFSRIRLNWLAATGSGASAEQTTTNTPPLLEVVQLRLDADNLNKLFRALKVCRVCGIRPAPYDQGAAGLYVGRRHHGRSQPGPCIRIAQVLADALI
jgi:ribose transport system permease protein